MNTIRPLILTLATLCFTNLLTAQDAAVPGKTKLKLDEAPEGKADPTLKLDPTGKLPAANKEDALAPLEMEAQAKPAELPAALKKLAPDQLQKYSNIREEATNFMKSVRLQESLEKLVEAERIVGEPVAEIENLRGAIYTKMRDFTNARVHFQKSVSLDKNSFHPQFNLAELDFVEKKFPSAIASFTSLIAENETLKKEAMAGMKEEFRATLARQFDTTKRLIEFKIFICQTLEKNSAEADKLIKGFNSYDNDSPAYYFAKAVQSFVKEQKETAEEWLASAKNIYPAALTEVYQDSMVEMGWMTTLAQ